MRLAGTILFLHLVSTAALAPVEGAPAAGQPIAWRERAFFIPFRVHRVSATDSSPVEVRLYVSSDLGKTWTQAGTADARKDSFVYRAPRDGAYWFSLRTVDQHGRLLPEGPHQPGLSVQVDTSVPQLEMSGVRGEAGEIHVQWKATDANLDPSSLQIGVRCEPGQQWQRLDIGRPPPTADSRSRSGQAAWLPPPACEAVLVRAEVRDRAGNPAVRQTRIVLSPDASANRAATIGAAAGRSPAANPGIAGRNGADPRASTVQRWPADHASDQPLDHVLSRESSQLSNVAPDVRQWPQTSMPVSIERSLSAQSVPAAGGHAVDRGAPPMPGMPPAASPPAADDQPPAHGNGRLSAGAFGVGIRPMVVGTRAFDLEYDVSPIDSSGVAKVELWGTRDGGRTWTSYGIDDDSRSPIRVHVDKGGTIGFRIVVESGSGRVGSPPTSGETPEIWVGVDLTRPTARIISATQGTDRNPNDIEIRWQAADENLAPRPIALHYSAHPGGPWSMVAPALENTGSYTWRTNHHVPAEVYLRLDVHDAAGNTTTVETSWPTSLTRPHPTGRIRSVRPVDRSASHTSGRQQR